MADSPGPREPPSLLSIWTQVTIIFVSASIPRKVTINFVQDEDDKKEKANSFSLSSTTSSHCG